MNDPRIVPSESREETKAIEQMIDNDIYFDEHERIHEVPKIAESYFVDEDNP